MNIQIDPKQALTTLLCLILLLLLANTAGIVSEVYLGHDHVYGLISLFNFNTVGNIPTFCSSCLLAIASMLLSLITLAQKRSGASYLPWMGLAFMFLFLSFDEMASIHERLTVPLKESLNTTGLLFYAWVILYGIAVVVLAVAYLPFLVRLPKTIGVLFVGSGIIFVAGALVLESLGGRHVDLHGKNNITHHVLYTCEELLEMHGVVIFIYALFLYMARQLKGLTITTSEERQ